MSAASVPVSTTRRLYADAATVLAVFVAMLLFIPSRYALTGIAGFVTPAFLVGMFAAWWWVHCRMVPGLGAAPGRQPVRLAVYFLLWSGAASCGGLFVRDHNDAEIRAIEAGLLVLVSSAGIALLAADGIRDRVRLDALLRWTVIGTSLVGVIVLMQFFLNFDLALQLRPPGFGILPGGLDFIQDRSVGVRRVAGTAAHPIEMGVVLTLLLPLAIHYGRFPTAGRARVYQAVAVLIAFTSFLTVSRSTIVAIAVEGLLLLPAWPDRIRIRALMVVPLVIVGVRLAAPGVVGTLVGLFTNAGSDNSFLHRVDDYGKASDFIAGALFFGRGLHTFIPTQYFYIDNSYLLSLLETGFLGLLASVLVFMIGLGVARGARRRSVDPATRDLGQSLAATIAAAMVTTFTYDSFSFPMATGLTFLFIGCAGALWRLEGGADAPATARPARESLAAAR